MCASPLATWTGEHIDICNAVQLHCRSSFRVLSVFGCNRRNKSELWRRDPDQSVGAIPSYIFQTWRSPSFTDCRPLKVMDMNPDYDYWFFEDDDQRYFMNEVMADEFDGKLKETYNLISDQNGAAKADLWRYAVLWKYGGVYLDFDCVCYVPFDDIIRSANASFIVSAAHSEEQQRVERYLKDHGDDNEAMLEWLAIEDPDHRLRPVQYQFMSSPKHAILTKVIQMICRRVLDKEYQSKLGLHVPQQGHEMQALTRRVTGPVAFNWGLNDGIMRRKLVKDRDYAIYGAHWKGQCHHYHSWKAFYGRNDKRYNTLTVPFLKVGDDTMKHNESDG